MKINNKTNKSTEKNKTNKINRFIIHNKIQWSKELRKTKILIKIVDIRQRTNPICK